MSKDNKIKIYGETFTIAKRKGKELCLHKWLDFDCWDDIKRFKPLQVVYLGLDFDVVAHQFESEYQSRWLLERWMIPTKEQLKDPERKQDKRKEYSEELHTIGEDLNDYGELL